MQDTSNFLDWAASQGIQFESLALKSFDGIRGIGIEQKRESGDTILTVPEPIVLRVLEQSSSLPAALEKENYVSTKAKFHRLGAGLAFFSHCAW